MDGDTITWEKCEAQWQHGKMGKFCWNHMKSWEMMGTDGTIREIRGNEKRSPGKKNSWGNEHKKMNWKYEYTRGQ